MLAETLQFIGKEADRWKEDELFGADEDSVIAYSSGPEAPAQLVGQIREALQRTTHSRLSREAGISEHTLRSILDFAMDVDPGTLHRLMVAVARERQRVAEQAVSETELLDWARRRAKEEGLSAFAVEMGYDTSNLAKVLRGRRTPSKRVLSELALARRTSG